jgi:hypothetical protein
MMVSGKVAQRWENPHLALSFDQRLSESRNLSFRDTKSRRSRFWNSVTQLRKALIQRALGFSPAESSASAGLRILMGSRNLQDLDFHISANQLPLVATYSLEARCDMDSPPIRTELSGGRTSSAGMVPPHYSDRYRPRVIPE